MDISTFARKKPSESLSKFDLQKEDEVVLFRVSLDLFRIFIDLNLIYSLNFSRMSKRKKKMRNYGN